jgi:hypothetical protein
MYAFPRVSVGTMKMQNQSSMMQLIMLCVISCIEVPSEKKGVAEIV